MQNLGFVLVHGQSSAAGLGDARGFFFLYVGVQSGTFYPTGGLRPCVCVRVGARAGTLCVCVCACRGVLHT